MSNPLHSRCSIVAETVSSTSYNKNTKGGGYSKLPNIYCCLECNVVFSPGTSLEIPIPIVKEAKN